MKYTYVGTISPHTGDYHVRVHEDDGKQLATSELPLRLDLRNHSPSGFAWGYLGSGPSQLALAILAHYTRNKERALWLYQSFKAEVIARLPQDDNFTLPGDDVAAWVKRARAQKKEAAK